jgi:hypothetical protein
MKLGALADVRFITAFNQLMAQDVSVRVAWKISQISKQINAHIKEYEEARQKLLKKHGTLKEDGSYVLDKNNNVVFAEGKEELFQEAFKELQNIDVLVRKVKMDDLNDAKLSAINIELLAPVMDQIQLQD